MVNGDLAAIPHRYENLALVVGVDQADEVAEHDTVFVAKSGARQQHRREAGVADVDGDAGGHEMGLAGLKVQVLVEAGVQVHAGGAVGGIARQREFTPEAGVQDLKFDFLPAAAFLGRHGISP